MAKKKSVCHSESPPADGSEDSLRTDVPLRQTAASVHPSLVHVSLPKGSGDAQGLLAPGAQDLAGPSKTMLVECYNAGESV